MSQGKNQKIPFSATHCQHPSNFIWPHLTSSHLNRTNRRSTALRIAISVENSTDTGKDNIPAKFQCKTRQCHSRRGIDLIGVSDYYTAISTPWQRFHRGICTHFKCFQVEWFRCQSFLSHSLSSESRNLCSLNVNPFSLDIPGSGLCRVSCRILSQWACTHQISICSAPMFQAVMLSHHKLPSSQYPRCTRKAGCPGGASYGRNARFA